MQQEKTKNQPKRSSLTIMKEEKNGNEKERGEYGRLKS